MLKYNITQLINMQIQNNNQLEYIVLMTFRMQPFFLDMEMQKFTALM